MLYIIGLTLAFIFGFIYGVGWEKRKLDNATPIDLKLAEQDLPGPTQEPETQDHPAKGLAIFYNYGGYNN